MLWTNQHHHSAIVLCLSSNTYKWTELGSSNINVSTKLMDCQVHWCLMIQMTMRVMMMIWQDVHSTWFSLVRNKNNQMRTHTAWTHIKLCRVAVRAHNDINQLLRLRVSLQHGRLVRFTGFNHFYNIRLNIRKFCFFLFVWYAPDPDSCGRDHIRR